MATYDQWFCSDKSDPMKQVYTTSHHTHHIHYTTLHYTTPHYTTLHHRTPHHTTPHHTSPTSPPDYIFLPWPSDDWQSVEGEPLRPQPSRARGEGGQTDSALAHSLHQGLLEHFWVDCHQDEMWRGRGSYYGVKLSGDVVEQSCTGYITWLTDEDPQSRNITAMFFPSLAIYDCSTTSPFRVICVLACH